MFCLLAEINVLLYYFMKHGYRIISLRVHPPTRPSICTNFTAIAVINIIAEQRVYSFQTIYLLKMYHKMLSFLCIFVLKVYTHACYIFIRHNRQKHGKTQTNKTPTKRQLKNQCTLNTFFIKFRYHTIVKS